MRRSLTPADAVAAAALHAAVLDDPWPAEAWEVLIGDPLAVSQAILIGGDLAGLALLRVVAGESEILMLLVAPRHRRRGLAAQLLMHSFEEAARRGARRVFLEVDAGNEGAIALYRRFGFVDVGRRTGYYNSPAGPRDALVLSRPLPLESGWPADIESDRRR